MTIIRVKYEHSTVPLWVMNLTAFCCIVTASLFLVYTYAVQRAAAEKKVRHAVLKTLPPIELLSVNPYASLGLEAKAAIVYDVSNDRIVLGYNEEMQLPLASITKLMTAIVAFETIPEYTAVPVVQRDVEYDPRLKVGEKWSLIDLLKYTLVSSSNTGADSAALATAAFLQGIGTEDTSTTSEDTFITAMNAKANEIGLSQTYFLNGSGLDTHAKISGAYGSAKDVAHLVSYMMKNHSDLLEPTSEERVSFQAPDGRIVEARNTNSMVETIPGIIGSKTGLTDLAGGNLAVAFDASFGQPFIIVVLGSSEEGRFSDARKLVGATITYMGSNLFGKIQTSSKAVIAP